MALITRIILVTCLILVVKSDVLNPDATHPNAKTIPEFQGSAISSKGSVSVSNPDITNQTAKVISKPNENESSRKYARNVTNTNVTNQAINVNPISNGIGMTSKDAISIIKATTSKKGIHSGTKNTTGLSENLESVSGVHTGDIAEGGVSKHAVYKPIETKDNVFEFLLNTQSPIAAINKVLDLKKYIRTKESLSASLSDKENVPVISMNVYNLNPPNEGNNFGSSLSSSRHALGNYILVNVSGEPALIPSILLDKTLLKEKSSNQTGIGTGNPVPMPAPFFDFWNGHPIKLSNDKLVGDHDAILEKLTCNQTHQEILKERLKHIEAFVREGLQIPELRDGSFDWDKITSHVIQEQPEISITTKQPEVTTKKVSLEDAGKNSILSQVEKYGIRFPKRADGSIDWERNGEIFKELEYDSTTETPVKRPIFDVTKKPETLDQRKQYLLKEHSKLGLPIPKNSDGSINWDVVVKHLISADTTKIPEIHTTKKPERFNNGQKIILGKLSALGIPIPKRPDGSIDWDSAKLAYTSSENIVTVTPKPALTQQVQEVADLYEKLGLELPKEPNGDVDWVSAYKYLISLQKENEWETERPIDKKQSELEKDNMSILQNLSNLGIPVPKLPNGDIDWLKVTYLLQNRLTTTETPFNLPLTTESPKGVIVMDKTDLLRAFEKLGLPVPTNVDGSPDWDAIIKYLIAHGYKIENGKISNKGFGISDLLNMSPADRLKLLERLQTLGLPISRLPNGQVDWRSIYSYLISNGYKIDSDGNTGGSILDNLGLMDRLNLLEKMKNSGVNIPRLATGDLDWAAISKYFAHNDGSQKLGLISSTSVPDRLKLLDQVRRLGIPLYTSPNGQYDWARILQAVQNQGYKPTGTAITADQNEDIAGKLTSKDKMQLLTELMRLKQPVPRLPGGGLDWNGIVRQLRDAPK